MCWRCRSTSITGTGSAGRIRSPAPMRRVASTAMPSFWASPRSTRRRWSSTADGRRSVPTAGEVEQALGSARRTRDEVPVALAVDHGRAQITLGQDGGRVVADLLLIGFDRRHVTEVSRGENGGRTLSHVDVVRSIEEIGQFDGGRRAFEVPIRSPGDRVAAILQARDGRVLGVAVARRRRALTAAWAGASPPIVWRKKQRPPRAPRRIPRLWPWPSRPKTVRSTGRCKR